MTTSFTINIIFLNINLLKAQFFGISGIFEVESYSEFAIIMMGMFDFSAVVADITVDVVVAFFTAQSEALLAIFPYHTHADLEIIVADISSVMGKIFDTKTLSLRLLV